MYPILAEWHDIAFYTYGFVMMSALFLIYFLASKQINESILNPTHLSDISFIIVFSIWFGGGLLSGLLMTNDSTLDALRENFTFHTLQQVSTMAISASFILTLLAYCLWKRLPFIQVLDFLIPYFTLGYALQRTFGCFSAGCCYGQPTTLPWGVTFGNTLGIGPETGIQVHPTQLYMGVAALLTTLIMLKNRHAIRQKIGIMTSIGITSLFGVYFLVTFYRGDLLWKSVYWGYEQAQIFSFALFVAGGISWLGLTIWHAKKTK